MTDCYWRWRFQPVFGVWGHLGVDFTFDSPASPGYLLRHLDYGLPGDCSCEGYGQSIGRYNAMVSVGGRDWPPLRTPFGRLFVTSEFQPAPRAVGEWLLTEAPRFWGPCGAYRTWGPNSNTGLRRTLDLCRRATGYTFGGMPLRFRAGAWGWDWFGPRDPHDGPCPGYFHDDSTGGVEDRKD
jgi:hypothetical protein